jgi:hypothetical protein
MDDVASTTPVDPANMISPSASPRTQGLVLYIQGAVTQLRQRERTAGTRDHDGLLFLGHWHDAHPRRLFHDPILEPVDKVVWAVIRHHADLQGATAFPSYQTIARCATIRSKATIARALMLLRITRWLSLCAQVRDARGRFQGNVYALHDEPLSLADALYLDADYLQFLQQMHSHPHDRVRQVASAVWATLHAEAAEASEAPAAGDELRQAKRQPIAGRTLATRQGKPSTSDHRVQNLHRPHRVQNLHPEPSHQVQNLNSVSEKEEKQADSIQVQNLNSVPISSSGSSIRTDCKFCKVDKNLQ